MWYFKYRTWSRTSELLLKYLSTSTSGLDERMSGGREGSRQLVKPRVGQMQRSPAVTLRKKKKKLSGKPPAEINALLYMFQSRFQIPFSCFYGFASIPVPIVTCLRGNSCVILAEADDWKQPQEQLASAKRTRSGQVISEPTSRSWSTSNPLC